MKYTSQRKRLADNTMVKASSRFKKDIGYAEGDWGKANTKYAPASTYDHEVRRGTVIEKEHIPSKNLKFNKEEVMKEKLLQGVIAEAKEATKCPNCGSTDTYSKPSDLLKNKCFNCKHEWPFKFITLNTSKSPVKESELPVTDCSVCGGKHHPGSKHLARALAPENNIEEARTGKGASGNPINQKGSWWKQLKKKLQMEDEVPKCADCGKDHAPDVPCPKKKLLFGDEHCEHCGESYSEGDPHHCWQSGHHNDVTETEWSTPDIRRPSVSPAELAMRNRYSSKPPEKHCQCGHPESFHDKSGCKTCHVSGNYTENLGANHKFTQQQWENEDLFSEDEGQKICWCGHPGHKHNKQGCKECRHEKVMKPQHIAHQFSARGPIKEDEITEGKDKEKQAKKKLALFNKSSAARQSRATIGPIPAQRVIVPKKDRKPKHKPDYMKEDRSAETEFADHTKNPFHNLLSQHGLVHIGTKHFKNNGALAKDQTPDTTSHTYAHSGSPKNWAVQVTLPHNEDRGGAATTPHAYHKCKNGDCNVHYNTDSLGKALASKGVWKGR